MISAYLDRLSAELRVPARTRARILAEARDHIEESIAAGRSEAEALAAFGEPGLLAARFHEELASSSARRASAHTVLLVAVFGIAMTLAAFGPANAFGLGIVVFIGAQLAAVAGAIAFVRWLRYRSTVAVPSDRLGDIYRANALTAGAIGVVALAELVNGLGAGRPALAVGGGVLLAAASAVGLRVRSASARARVVPAAAPDEDVLDDVVAVGNRYAPQLMSAVQRTPAWLDLRHKPWRFCLVFATMCGLALAGWHALVEAGGPPDVSNVARALLAGVVIASIEAVAVIACFAAFGRFLGIRR
ncbi:MAG TPA: hypothetical protein VJU60_08235 [Thermoleophilaceae bacterium]|nr:hypothetical protein [Thermoleophilaceae bacterium]